MDKLNVITGERGQYRWMTIYTQYPLLSLLLKGVPELVKGKCVAITSFDGGPLTPNQEERERGWHCVGDVLWTTPINDPSLIPDDNHDEWYIFDDEINLGEVANFVNYGEFVLDDPEKIAERLQENPTWDRVIIQEEIERKKTLQDRFWRQIKKYNPVSFVAEGDTFNLATRYLPSFEKLLRWSENPFRYG